MKQENEPIGQIGICIFVFMLVYIVAYYAMLARRRRAREKAENERREKIESMLIRNTNSRSVIPDFQKESRFHRQNRPPPQVRIIDAPSNAQLLDQLHRKRVQFFESGRNNADCVDHAQDSRRSTD